MAVIIKIPADLRRYTNNENSIKALSGRFKDILQYISLKYPELAEKIIEKNGSLNGYIKFYIEGENPRIIFNNNIEVKDGETLALFRLVPGG